MESATPSPVALLVDDNDSVRRALKMLMKSIGWQAMEAADGKSALSLLEDHTYDLVIVDINMPKMNGIELCRLIHSEGSTAAPPCIVFSGLVDAKIRAEACSAGALAVMTKPMGRQELIEEFKKHGLPCL
jgi:CheY-like chemotaxis protein